MPTYFLHFLIKFSLYATSDMTLAGATKPVEFGSLGHWLWFGTFLPALRRTSKTKEGRAAEPIATGEASPDWQGQEASTQAHACACGCTQASIYMCVCRQPLHAHACHLHESMHSIIQIHGAGDSPDPRLCPPHPITLTFSKIWIQFYMHLGESLCIDD